MELETIQNEVKEIHERILAECEKNEEVKKHYGGCQIFFSPFHKKADVLLIGINPGSGYLRHEGSIVEKFSPLGTPEKGYPFIDQIVEVFRNAGKEDILETTVRTNVYFFSTYGTGDWNNFLKLLPMNLKDEINEETKKWLRELIHIVSPKMIVCAGTTVFDHVRNSNRNEMISIQEEIIPFEGTYCGIPVLAYRRTKGGDIDPGGDKKNIPRLKEKLHDYMVRLGIIK